MNVIKLPIFEWEYLKTEPNFGKQIMLASGYTLINVLKNQQKSLQAIVMKRKKISVELMTLYATNWEIPRDKLICTLLNA